SSHAHRPSPIRIPFARPRRRGSLLSVFMGNVRAVPGIPSGHYPVSVAFGDLNRDGRPDIAAPNETSYATSRFPGNGDATFHCAGRSPAGVDTFSVVMADLHRDGSLDHVSANYSINNVYVDFGSGTDGLNSS